MRVRRQALIRYIAIDQVGLSLGSGVGIPQAIFDISPGKAGGKVDGKAYGEAHGKVAGVLALLVSDVLDIGRVARPHSCGGK